MKYLNEIYSLTGLTKKSLGEVKNGRTGRVSKRWFYEGENLADIYNETYSFD